MNDTVKQTRREKLMQKYEKAAAAAAKLTAEIKLIVDEVAAIDALESIEVGTPVIASIGKGAGTTEVHATVIGVKLDDDGSKVYKVQYGSGFDADIAVIRGTRLKLVQATVEAVQAE